MGSTSVLVSLQSKSVTGVQHHVRAIVSPGASRSPASGHAHSPGPRSSHRRPSRTSLAASLNLRLRHCRRHASGATFCHSRVVVPNPPATTSSRHCAPAHISIRLDQKSPQQPAREPAGTMLGCVASLLIIVPDPCSAEHHSLGPRGARPPSVGAVPDPVIGLVGYRRVSEGAVRRFPV